MTVRELIVALMNMPDPQAPVILSRDPEGEDRVRFMEGYSQAESVGAVRWSDRYDAVVDGEPNAVCLWPRG